MAKQLSVETIFKLFESQAAYNYIDFKEIPDEHYINFCKVAVHASPHALNKVDKTRAGDAYKSIAWNSVHRWPFSIEFVHPTVENYMELAEMAVKQQPTALFYIHNPTHEIARIAVMGDGSTLQAVPKELHDKEIVRAAIRSNGAAFDLIDSKQYSDDEYLSLAMLAALSYNEILSSLDLSRISDKNYAKIAKIAAVGAPLSVIDLDPKRLSTEDYKEIMEIAMTQRNDNHLMEVLSAEDLKKPFNVDLLIATLNE